MGGDTIIHKLPPEDILDHDQNSHHCWCEPTYEFRHDRIVIYHRRADELHDHAIGYKPETPHAEAPEKLLY